MDATPGPEHGEHRASVRAESFYFDDDPMAIFLVENQLFKVHRHHFIQGSEIFRDMFSQSRPQAGEEVGPVAEGMSDEKPIVLSGVTVKEFRALLRYFYPTSSSIPNTKTLANVLHFEQDEKLALLSIAHKFVFDQIFEYICGELEPEKIPVADRVRLGNKYNLNKWLSSAYQAILERSPDEKLSQEEADALGLEMVVKVLESRNAIWHQVYQNLKQAWPRFPNHRMCCTHCKSFLYVGCNNKQDYPSETQSVVLQNAITRGVELLLS